MFETVGAQRYTLSIAYASELRAHAGVVHCAQQNTLE
jgi:hypothetical protein